MSLRQFFVRGFEFEYQHGTSVHHLAPGHGELKATEQVVVQREIPFLKRLAVNVGMRIRDSVLPGCGLARFRLRHDRLRSVRDGHHRRIVRAFFQLALLELSFGIAVFGHLRARVAVTLAEQPVVGILLFRVFHHPPEHRFS